MSELKTLKDIKLMADFQIDGDDFGGLHDVALIDDLKLEAIKRIKDFQSRTEIKGRLTMPTAEICFENTERDVRSNLAKAEVLTEFFNITEEDLNE